MTDNDQNTHENPRREEKPRDHFFKLRNVLNIIFMLGAIAGVLIFFFAGKTLGTIVILAAMVFKIVECSLRFFH